MSGLVTERLVEFELRLMVPPVVPLRATRQRLEESGPSVPGVQDMELIPDIAGGATSERVVVVGEPFSVPVTVTV